VLATLAAVEHVVVIRMSSRARSSQRWGRGPPRQPVAGVRRARPRRRVRHSYPSTIAVHPVFVRHDRRCPSGIVHGAGGTLLQHQKEHLLHNDLQAQRPACSIHYLWLDDVNCS